PALAPWVLTVLHHAHWGVDLFFVLSGFSLAQGYIRAFAGGPRAPPSPRAFLRRRAARILPAYCSRSRRSSPPSASRASSTSRRADLGLTRSSRSRPPH